MNQDIIRKITDQDYEAIAGRICRNLQVWLKSSKASGFVLGLSGGIDSAVVASLCSRVSKDTLALVMPDSEITPDGETDDALELARSLGIKYHTIDIRNIIAGYADLLRPHPMAEGNLRARIRTSILYYYANMDNLLVTGSSDRSEYQIGYFTKYGDGAADIFPMISLYKLQVRGLAAHLGVPYHIVSKKSSPHLWKGHTAEGEIGASYEETDTVLHLYLDRMMQPEAIQSVTGISTGVINRIISLNEGSRHKREPTV